MNNILTQYKSSINLAMLTLISLAFVTIDWNVYIVTFSDYILVSVLLFFVLTRNVFIRFKEAKIVLSIVSLLCANVLFHYLFNDVSIRPSLAAIIRLTFYLISVILLYNFINVNHLKKKLLFTNNIVAVLVTLVGLYISLVLYFESDLPYDFLWTFTRSDTQSYMFRGANKVIRTRSIFSEPSHFGFYLNVILGINLFSKENIKYMFWFNSILVGALISTLSYSALAIMFVVLLIYAIGLIKADYTVLTTKQSLLGIVLFAIALYVSRDLIYTTIITRTRDIYMGYDNSAFERIIESWRYVDRENLIFGNGLGHTPHIFNNYAYMLSDIGVYGFIGSLLFTIYLTTKNFGLGLLFFMLNFQKGGYLSPSFWIMLLLIMVFSLEYKSKRYIFFTGGRKNV